MEDDTVDQLAFIRLAEQDGLPYDYTIAESVAEAREFLSRGWCEIVITDYILGDGTAFDLLDAPQGIPMISATGTGDEELAMRAISNGPRKCTRFPILTILQEMASGHWRRRRNGCPLSIPLSAGSQFAQDGRPEVVKGSAL